MILGAASLLFGCTPYEKMNAAAFEQATLSADGRIVDIDADDDTKVNLVLAIAAGELEGVAKIAELLAAITTT